MTRIVRLPIPPESCIVVLDASPARNLAYAPECPAWVKTFERMARDGYSFSLADGAFAELLTQFAKGAINEEGFGLMLTRLQMFLNPDLPTLPGKRDILAAIGASNTDPTWSAKEVADLSVRSWEFLNNVAVIPLEKRPTAAEELQEEREDWFALFDQMLAAHNPCCAVLDERGGKQLDLAFAHMDRKDKVPLPPLSVRCDLQLRLAWRQYVRSRNTKEAYNPRSPKKRNDGIDFDLYRYLMLPAFVVADDSGFFSKIKNIESFQTSWFWKAEALAAAWESGIHPCPLWPTVT